MRNIPYSIVIPVYNSYRSLPELVTRIHRVFARDIQEEYEIILVDDCSPRPETWAKIHEIAKENTRVRGFKLTRNMGKPGALLCGLSKARGQYIVTMDDDLQHRPEDIPLLASKKDHDVVIAQFPKKQCGFFKKTCSNLKGKLDAYLLGKPPHIYNSPFKIINKRISKAILKIETPRPFIMGLILYVTKDLVNVTVSHEERKFGKSQYSFRKSFSQFSNMIFNNSSFMLRLMSVIGISIASMSLLYGGYLIARWFWHDQRVAGWTSLMVMLTTATGMILFCLGILGEYVARLIATAERRPMYIVKESINDSNEDRKIESI